MSAGGGDEWSLAGSSSPTEAHKEPEAIAPPDNYSMVEPGLYRSALPTARHFPFVRGLRLRTAIILCAERPGRNIETFFEAHGVSVAHTGLQGWSAESSWKPVADEVVKESVELLLSRERYPVLLCDATGVHLVGIVVACVRRLQRWNLNSVFSEYRLYAGAAKMHYAHELFVELFDVDLVNVPDGPPAWFAELVEMEERERDELRSLAERRMVDASGALLAVGEQDGGAAPFEVHYYSSSGPLNSRVGGATPRIRTH